MISKLTAYPCPGKGEQFDRVLQSIKEIVPVCCQYLSEHRMRTNGMRYYFRWIPLKIKVGVIGHQSLMPYQTVSYNFSSRSLLR